MIDRAEFLVGALVLAMKRKPRPPKPSPGRTENHGATILLLVGR